MRGLALCLLLPAKQVRAAPAAHLRCCTRKRAGRDASTACAKNNLSFAAADLENDAGWAEAVAGFEFVQHVASPFPIATPKHEDELIIPAREGTLRVLRAARDAHVSG